jgi:hypothetical protein
MDPGAPESEIYPGAEGLVSWGFVQPEGTRIDMDPLKSNACKPLTKVRVKSRFDAPTLTPDGSKVAVPSPMAGVSVAEIVGAGVSVGLKLLVEEGRGLSVAVEFGDGVKVSVEDSVPVTNGVELGEDVGVTVGL